MCMYNLYAQLHMLKFMPDLPEALEVEDEYLWRRPQHEPLDALLLAVTRGTVPRIAAAQLLSARVKLTKQTHLHTLSCSHFF